MSTIIGLVSTFRLPLHFIISYNTFWGVECVVVFVLDFVRHVLACYAQSSSSGASVWTFQVLFLLLTSNLLALVRRFGLSKSCFCPQHPICQSRHTVLDFQESNSTKKSNPSTLAFPFGLCKQYSSLKVQSVSNIQAINHNLYP